jgi:hypothetical protein
MKQIKLQKQINFPEDLKSINLQKLYAQLTDEQQDETTKTFIVIHLIRENYSTDGRLIPCY